MIASFEFGGAQSNREPSAAVGDCKSAVFEDFTAGLSSGVPVTLVNQFELEGREEARRPPRRWANPSELLVRRAALEHGFTTRILLPA
jgi:hypothetical protein